MSDYKSRKVLILGAGPMAQYVVFVLLEYDIQIIVASTIGLEEIQSKFPKVQTEFLDVQQDKEKLRHLVERSEIIISMLPVSMHMFAAEVCLQVGRSLVTSSYLSQEIAALDQQCKEKNLTFLMEAGLDPGIDHLMFKESMIANPDWKLISYESYCGGLPVPELCDHPFAYMFTWAPYLAMIGPTRGSQILLDKQIIKYDGIQTTQTSFQYDLHPALKLEGYYNRDAVEYVKKQGVLTEDLQKAIRVTLRYKGWVETVQGLYNLGLYSQDEVAGLSNQTWGDVLLKLTSEPVQQKIQQKEISELQDLMDQIQIERQTLINVVSKCKFSNSCNISTYALKIILHIFITCSIKSDEKIDQSAKSYYSALLAVMTRHFTIKPGQPDLTYLSVVLGFQKPDGSKVEKFKQMIIRGTNEWTSVQKTVGTTAAEAVICLLDGSINVKGVCVPKDEQIIKPLIKKLALHGITWSNSELASQIKQQEQKPIQPQTSGGNKCKFSLITGLTIGVITSLSIGAFIFKRVKQ